jgi:hypothetical protein
MIHGNQYRRRASLSGWWKCAPLLALPFGMFFTEAWLQTNILRNNYKVHELTLEQRALETSIKELSDGRSHLSRIERIDSQAPRLGLIKPLPGQRRILRETVVLASSNPLLEEQDAGAPTRLAMSNQSLRKSGILDLEVALPPMDGLSGTE